jgi:hypothetical protein
MQYLQRARQIITFLLVIFPPSIKEILTHTRRTRLGQDLPNIHMFANFYSYQKIDAQ